MLSCFVWAAPNYRETVQNPNGLCHTFTLCVVPAVLSEPENVTLVFNAGYTVVIVVL
jgi:hypothetical protein